jgi:hypothetical protein
VRRLLAEHLLTLAEQHSEGDMSVVEVDLNGDGRVCTKEMQE